MSQCCELRVGRLRSLGTMRKERLRSKTETAVPESYHTVTPYLVIGDAARAWRAPARSGQNQRQMDVRFQPFEYTHTHE